MKRTGLIICSAFLAACASETRPTVASPARYATPDEAERLHEQAAANFQRERERQGGAVASRNNSGSRQRVIPQSEAMQASALPPVMEGPAPTPRKVSIAEARYAMQIGKSPYDLTPAERAVATLGY